MRIVQLANFCPRHAGGRRVAVDHLGAGYRAAGHETVLIVPGPEHRVDAVGGATVVTVRSPRVPAAAGCRVIADIRPVVDVLEGLRPDRIEVSDKSTMVFITAWARRYGVPSVLLSHERLDAMVSLRIPPWLPRQPLVDAWNRRLVGWFDTIVVASQFAASEFTRVEADNLALVPFGVDLGTFRPRPDRAARTERWRLAYVGRLAPEKRPELAIEVTRLLRAAGTDVGLSILGSGPMEPALRARARGLPVDFLGFVGDRRVIAGELARADIAIVPCPVESFGLVALEAMACGTPVVVSAPSGAVELLAPDGGRSAPATSAGMARAIQAVMATPRDRRESAARARAEEFPWSLAVERMLKVHHDARVRH